MSERVSEERDVEIFSPTVGYIVGLGDRHVQNILIDTNSAELIHIDLGKLRPKPRLFMQMIIIILFPIPFPLLRSCI